MAGGRDRIAVRRVSLAEATFVVALLALIATVVYGEVQRRLAQKQQLALAKSKPTPVLN
jgi:hypothetical protein